MKALTFLEFFNSQYDVKTAILDHIGIKIYDEDWYDPNRIINIVNRQYAEFVGQKFEPEKIPELFEGWNRDDEFKPHYYCQTNIGGVYIKTCGIGFYSIDGEVYIMPSNIDDLISDCKRAGIDLILKEKK